MNYWAEATRPDGGRYKLLALHQTTDKRPPPPQKGGKSMLSITKELYYVLVAVGGDVFKARETIKKAIQLFDIPDQYKGVQNEKV